MTIECSELYQSASKPPVSNRWMMGRHAGEVEPQQAGQLPKKSPSISAHVT